MWQKFWGGMAPHRTATDEVYSVHKVDFVTVREELRFSKLEVSRS